MEIKKLTPTFAVSAQLSASDMSSVAAAGYRTIICNRPDNEADDQIPFADIEKVARANSVVSVYLPISANDDATDSAVDALLSVISQNPAPALAYSRSGACSAKLWALAAIRSQPVDEVLKMAKNAGYDLSSTVQNTTAKSNGAATAAKLHHDIVIVGGGSAGIAVATSLLARDHTLDIAIIEPSDVHYYQPGWTMVGGGIFNSRDTVRPMQSLMPKSVAWIKAAVTAFHPHSDSVSLNDGRQVGYGRLIVCPGLKLDWNGIEGLPETLGRNGVTSNYRIDLAPYTWELVQGLKSGRAIFSQPPMPIKCAGAPQKAMYLSADYWQRMDRLKNIRIDFCTSTAALFGVADYVPALMKYVERYHANLCFGETLVRVNGPEHKAWFQKTTPAGEKTLVERTFDMLHVVPPQTAPDFIKASPLADAAGWVDVDHHTLRHKSFKNIYSLGDACCTPNAKTVAAVRKQAPIVAHNVLADLGRRSGTAYYDGYGACPLTVERGKIVLAEFAYGGKLAPSFPKSVIDGTRPSRAAWTLKAHILPKVYWDLMLKGREWMAKPTLRD